MAFPIFSGSGNTTGLLTTSSDVRTSCKSKMVTGSNSNDNNEFPMAIHITFSQKHGFSHWNFVAFMYTSYMIYVILYPLPANGCHLWFTTYPFNARYHVGPFMFLNLENIVAIVGMWLLSCAHDEIRALAFQKPPSWISDWFLMTDFWIWFHLVMIPMDTLRSLTLSTWILAICTWVLAIWTWIMISYLKFFSCSCLASFFSLVETCNHVTL